MPVRETYGRPFSANAVDMDDFKQVNDTHGHEAGDEALRTLARVLQQGTRGIDLAARIGGEEFAVILTETNLAGATEVAERLRTTLRGTEIPPIGQIAASFGVAECPSQATTALSCWRAPMPRYIRLNVRAATGWCLPAKPNRTPMKLERTEIGERIMNAEL